MKSDMVAGTRVFTAGSPLGLRQLSASKLQANKSSLLFSVPEARTEFFMFHQCLSDETGGRRSFDGFS